MLYNPLAMANGLFYETNREHPWLWLALGLLISMPPMLMALAGQGAVGEGSDAVAAVVVDVLEQVGFDSAVCISLTPAVAAAVILVATYWAGCTLGGVTMALVSTVAIGTMWCFQRQVQLASASVYAASAATLAIASAIWAMAPFMAPPGHLRRIGGWLIAALALGGAVAAQGLTALAITCAVLLLIILLVHSDRSVNLLSLLLVMAIAASLGLPWHLSTEAADMAAGRLARWEADDLALAAHPMIILVLTVPWTPWLMAGLLMPLLPHEEPGGGRRWLLIPWVWFMLLLVVGWCFSANQPLSALSLLPAAGLLVGLVWSQHQQFADRGERPAGAWRFLCILHWTFLIVASLAAGPILLCQEMMVDYGWFDRLPLGPIPPEVVIVGGVVLTGIAIVGAWQHHQWRPRRAAIITALWSSVLLTMLWLAGSGL